MAAISSSNVTVLNAYEIGNRTGKSQGVRLYLAIVLSAQGAAAGDIPASALGLKQITFAQAFGTAANLYTPVGVSTPGVDGNYIYPVNIENATDASRGDPANYTGTLYVMVEGVPAAS